MLRDFEFVHGVVFARMLHGANQAFSVGRFSSAFNAGYLIDDKIGLYVKHCNKRLTPWRFSFQGKHLRQFASMTEGSQRMFVVLVCDNDGIVCLDHSEVELLIDNQREGAKWIRIDRRPGQMYAVTGSDGALAVKIGVGDFPRKIFEALN